MKLKRHFPLLRARAARGYPLAAFKTRRTAGHHSTCTLPKSYVERTRVRYRVGKRRNPFLSHEQTMSVEMRHLTHQPSPGPIDDGPESDIQRKCEICGAFYTLSDNRTLTCRRHPGRFRHTHTMTGIDRLGGLGWSCCQAERESSVG
jgi:hypothetical protein